MNKITRQKRTENFTIVDNDIIQNRALSWAAKGMLIYLLHLPDNWEINVADLANRSKNGRDGTATIIKELIGAGYISRVKIKNEKAQFKGYDYTVTDKPVNGNAVNGLSVNGNAVNGLSVNGSSENGKAEASKYYQEEELSEVSTNEVNIVENEFSTVLIDEVDESLVEIHHVPEYFADEQIDPTPQVAPPPPPQKKRKPKVDNPAPVTPMWEAYLKEYARTGKEAPVFLPRYAKDLKMLFSILRTRAIDRGELPLDSVEPFRDYCAAVADYILFGRDKNGFIGRNFNPGYLHTGFNTIISSLQEKPVQAETKSGAWAEWAKRQQL